MQYISGALRQRRFLSGVYSDLYQTTAVALARLCTQPLRKVHGSHIIVQNSYSPIPGANDGAVVLQWAVNH